MAHALRAELQRQPLHNVLFAGSTAATEPAPLPLLQGRLSASESRIFVCRDHACQLPVATAEAAIAQLG
jgi:uncharacterized protein YyaL (SSP411 family)